MKFILDTNLYISADRDSARATELQRFYQRYFQFTFLHAVVAYELRAGVHDRARKRQLERTVLEPFERIGRLVAPSFRAWKLSGEAVSRLMERGALTSGGFTRSFLGDILLAVTCHQGGYVLVTENRADFERIRDVLDFDFRSVDELNQAA